MTSGAPAANAVQLFASVVPLVPAWRVDKPFHYSIPPELSARVSVGSLVRVPFGGRKVRGVVTGLQLEPPERTIDAIAAVVMDLPVCPPPLNELFEWLAIRYVVPRGRAFARSVPSRVRIKAEPTEALRVGGAPRVLPSYEGGDRLLAAIGSGSGTWCLRPTPQSDAASEVLELVNAALDSGGSALVVTPEVVLSDPVRTAVEERWPEVALVGSDVDDATRARNWLRAGRDGGVVLGGRAALFVPLQRLRVIVLTEEHHQSLKEDRAPKYDAKRVAVERARLEEAVCVLLSATPTLETGSAAADGRYSLAEPPRSVARAARPIVETAPVPTGGPVSRLLHERLRQTLQEGGRTALLVPRAGYAHALWCPECHNPVRCPRCETTMSFDRNRGAATCPHCANVLPAPDRCPRCGHGPLRFVGAGSQRVEEQVQRAFPRATVARVDPETFSSPQSRDADIYVTTWIGTKPAVRPDVSLVGILDADALIHRADFHASESAFEALSAMAGWAGPADRGGRLVVQTADPGHHSIQATVRGDYNYFLRHELEARRELAYPPFAELIRIRVRGPQADAAIEQIRDAAERRRARIVGPVEVEARARAGWAGPQNKRESASSWSSVRTPPSWPVTCGLS